MRAIKIISTILIIVLWLAISTLCGDYLIVHGGNALNTIFIMAGSFLYGSLTLWLLYGFTGKKHEAVLRWIAVGLALSPIASLITIFYLISNAEVRY